MATEADKREWLKRVLGLNLGEEVADRSTVNSLSLWREAKEEVDRQLEVLAQALRSYEDTDANYVADHGLFGLTGGGETVGLMAAMTSFDGAPPNDRTAAGTALRAALGRYRAALDASPLVALVDDNPFGVTVGLRETIGGALARIEAALA